jgi:hypothetical protein
MLNALQVRWRGAIEECVSTEQGGFRKERSTVQQILTLKLVTEEVLDRGENLCNCFTGFTKAYDFEWHTGI